MKQKIVEISSLKQSEVLEKLTWQNEYAFAAWQYPNSSDNILLISLKKPSRLEANLEDSDTGFLANTFKDSHPVRPWFISADITFHGDEKVEVDPRISGNELEKFLEYINNLDRPKKKNKPTTQEGLRGKGFVDFVSKAVGEIDGKEVFKIVPSRFEDNDSSDVNLSDLYEKICQTYPSAFCNLWSLGNGEFWAGATPESLISFENNIFSTVALAGTQLIPEGEKLANIGWTQKEIEEQALVSRYIINCFKKLRIREFEEYGPKTIAAGNLAHLSTIFEVDLSKIHFEQLTDQMLELLHPTSAVCGMPRKEAAMFLEENEGYDRSFYSGFIGPINFENSTKLFVNLRCMRVKDGITRFYAGAGVTEDSNPEKELKETDMKMEVMKKMIKSK